MTYMSIIVPTFFQPIRKTKRRELNKYKQQGRHHRQQTPPPPSYYGLDEDASSDEYGSLYEVMNGCIKIKIFE